MADGLLISNCREGSAHPRVSSLFFPVNGEERASVESWFRLPVHSTPFPSHRFSPLRRAYRVLFPRRLNAKNRTEPVSWNNGGWLPRRRTSRMMGDRQTAEEMMERWSVDAVWRTGDRTIGNSRKNELEGTGTRIDVETSESELNDCADALICAWF